MAKGYFGVDAGAPQKTPEEMALDLAARLATQDDSPVGRWQSCLERLGALREANPQKPLVQCIDTVDVCGDDRGGPGCCPRACIDLQKRLCAGGACEDPKRDIDAFAAGVLRGDCVAGYSDMMAPAHKMAAEASGAQIQERRESRPLLYVGGSGIVLASRRGGLIASRDDGLTWAPVNDGLEHVDVRALVETSSGRLLAADVGHVYRWQDNARRWIGRELSTTAGQVLADHLEATKSGMAFLHADRAVWASHDDGDSWQRLPPVRPYAGAFTMAISREDELLVGTDGAPSMWRRRNDSWEAIVTDEHISDPRRIWPLPEGRLFVVGFQRRLMNPDGHVVEPERDAPKGTTRLEWMLSLSNIVPLGGRLFALNYATEPELWQSTDVSLWRRATLPMACDERVQSSKDWAVKGRCAVRSIVSTRGGALLVASKDRIMRSTDGETWTTVHRD